jgi:hypothetical protein
LNLRRASHPITRIAADMFAPEPIFADWEAHLRARSTWSSRRDGFSSYADYLFTRGRMYPQFW